MNNKELLQELENQKSDSMFQLKLHEGNIAVVLIDVRNKTKNWLDKTFIDKLESVVNKVDSWGLKGLLFISANENSFVQGFTLNTLEDEDNEGLMRFAERTQALINNIKELKVPTVAAIHGSCYGLGLEIALACDYRVASRSSFNTICYATSTLRCATFCWWHL